MARPKRQSRATENRKRRERLRLESRAKATIAKQEKRAQAKADRALFGPSGTTTTTPIRVVKATVRRGRTLPKGALPPGPREILIVSRKGQPQRFTTVEALERRDYPPESISSSWLSTYGYFYNDRIGLFTTISGKQYKIINFDFDTWEEWYYSHSKGTFFNDFIRDQYTIKSTL